MIVVVMGVSGCGKSTVGAALAERLGWRFLDADELHPPANVAKLAAGIPLDDEDRWPWLDRIVEALRAATAAGEDVVLACSALKQAYRDRLAQAGPMRFVHLAGEPATIASRLAARTHPFMPARLLASQLATLEPPADAIVVDVGAALDDQLDQIVRALGLAARG